MAYFAYEPGACISHLLPSEQEMESKFGGTPPESEGEEEESFDFTVPLEQEHLEAIARYQELIKDKSMHPDDKARTIMAFLQEMNDSSFPFAFWYECCQSSEECDYALAFILLMMSNEADSPHESIHALYNSATEAVGGVLEYGPEALQVVLASVENSKQRLSAYVPLHRQAIADALWENYLETIDRGDDDMDAQLAAIEDVYLKMISSN